VSDSSVGAALEPEFEAATAAAPRAHAAALRAPWRGLLEFCLVGGATLPLFPLSVWLRHHFGLDAAELGTGFIFFYAAYVLNDPHFTVTYLLFYRDVKARAFGNVFGRAQRLRYWLAGFAAPAILLVWAGLALGLRSAALLGGMIELMFLLVGWHYVKQGFGVLMVLSARRGVRMTRLERFVLLAHCHAGWAYAWANPAVPAREDEEKGVVYWAIAHPRGLELCAGFVLGLTLLALLWVLAAKWRRERRLPPPAALVGFLVTIWSWSIYSSLDPLVRYAIPALHSLQYLYFVGSLTRRRALAQQGAPLFGPTPAVRLGLLAAGAIGLGCLGFHVLPGALDEVFFPHRRGHVSPAPLGPTPFLAAFFVIINLHHYLMDHVIWRRENPDLQSLFRG
jgi:hypothetical protein